MLNTKSKQPFVTVEYAARVFKTKVLYNACQDPVWNNEIFTIDSNYKGRQLVLRVFGKDNV
jgi:hypothetical protein